MEVFAVEPPDVTMSRFAKLSSPLEYRVENWLKFPW
jgi:hypothetical protein